MFWSLCHCGAELWVYTQPYSLKKRIKVEKLKTLGSRILQSRESQKGLRRSRYSSFCSPCRNFLFKLYSPLIVLPHLEDLQCCKPQSPGNQDQLFIVLVVRIFPPMPSTIHLLQFNLVILVLLSMAMGRILSFFGAAFHVCKTAFSAFYTLDRSTSLFRLSPWVVVPR